MAVHLFATGVRRATVIRALLVWPALAIASAAAAPGALVLDRFNDASAWTAKASDDVKASLRSVAGVAGVDGGSLCLDFDFGHVSGYAIARRELPLDLPSNYAFELHLRGDAAANDLQFKLVDASGENVWWYRQADFAFPHDWRMLTIKQRQIAFAWGPAKDHVLRHSDALELVVSSGHGGGRGSVCFDRLALRELPAADAPLPTPTAIASSAATGSEAMLAIDGDRKTAWRSASRAAPEQQFSIDFGQPREFGGLTLHWLPNAAATRYDIQVSDDGRQWRTIHRVLDGDGGDDPLYLPETETRWLRFSLHARQGAGYGLAEIDVEPLAFGATPNAFFEALAKHAPRGRYPRSFSGEQTYWTIVGTDGLGEPALLSEDGAVEFRKGGASVEPFVLLDDKLIGWADVHAVQSLQDGYLPIPSVDWARADLGLRVTAFADGAGDRSQLYVRYVLRNPGKRAHNYALVLAIRPFQVNPPSQFLNTAGGFSPIHTLEIDNGSTIRVDHTLLFAASAAPAVLATSFDAGMVIERIAAGGRGLNNRAAVANDADGFASGALIYRLRLQPGESREFTIHAPLSDNANPSNAIAVPDARRLAALQDRVARRWRDTLNRVGLRLPQRAQRVADTLRSALAQILISRRGPALQPGTRSYARSWIRDGAMISEALLRLGHAGVARDFVQWYAPHQFADGKVPCCVDARGADPVPENDSPGELIFAIAEVFRYTGDRAFLDALWPRVKSAAAYMERLRQSERKPINREPATQALYGLLPASISHEGYSAKPMHSYWDDFWALKGYKDAAALARVLGDPDARSIQTQADQFAADLYASIQVAGEIHHIDYLPGAAELGDFDPTSTTIALSPAGEQARLPQARLRATFERYWREFVARRDGTREWADYTPYELRNIGAFVRLGWRDRAQQLLAFFLADQQPVGWNQWAEVVGHARRTPRFIGDLPHAWVASDYIRSVLDLFAYARDSDQSLVLAAGVPAAWLDDGGIEIENLRTPYGKLGYTLKRADGRIRLSIRQGLQLPSGGIVFAWPGDLPPGTTRINAVPAQWSNGELRIRSLPAEIVVDALVRH